MNPPDMAAIIPGSCRLRHSATCAPSPSWGSRSRLEGPMRTYLTVIGMALGLVAVWAALVPFVA